MSERFLPDTVLGDDREGRVISQYAIQQVVDEIVAVFVGEFGLKSFDLSVDVRPSEEGEPRGHRITGSIVT